MELAEYVKIQRVDEVILREQRKELFKGTLVITGHYLMITSSDGNDFCLLHKAIDICERKQTGAYFVLTLKMKDFRCYDLQIPGAEEARLVQQSIDFLSSIENIIYSIAFNFVPNFDMLENGWNAFHIKEEFSWLLNSREWRITQVNNDFSISPSYPKEIIVPDKLDDKCIIESSKFRHLGRFPLLAYYHKEKRTCLLRSSQPLVGPSNRRNKSDEYLLERFIDLSKRGLIVDTRSTNSVKQAQSKGGGTEGDCYPLWKKINQPLERYSNINVSFQKFIEACQDSTLSTEKWLSKLESSNWLGHIRDLLAAAKTIALKMDSENFTVLVHGAEGFDSTLQLTSLVQVILQPDCRTIRGFEALVDREWIQGGHPFADRCMKSAFCSTKEHLEAPIFLLFLDSVWQIWQQNPCAFEFTDNFLMLLAKHAYFSEYGTFICNNEKSREQWNVRQKTVSLWSYVNQPSVMTEYLNPLYDPCKSDKTLYACWPSTAPQSLNIWQELYQSQVIDTFPIQLLRDQLRQAKEEQNQLKCKAIRMRRILAGLEREAIHAGVLSTSRDPPAK